MELFDIIKTILFGIVEGITEWLPISSTGHMILLNEILPLKIGDSPKEFYSMFEVVIQLGAIMAVVILFWSQIWPFGKKNNNAPLKENGIGAWIKTDIFALWFHILVSAVPAAVIGILFDDVFEKLVPRIEAHSLLISLPCTEQIAVYSNQLCKWLYLHTEALAIFSYQFPLSCI